MKDENDERNLSYKYLRTAATHNLYIQEKNNLNENTQYVVETTREEKVIKEQKMGKLVASMRVLLR